ncbi:MAG: monovalent cation/H+ antiporter subunit D [Alphaproteobacteria bacterium]
MNHWIVAPIVIPALVAPLIVLMMRRSLSLQRIFSLASAAAVLAISVALLIHAANNPPEVYQLGNWAAPFGIVLVLDRLSALMVTLTSLLSLLVLLYAIDEWDHRGWHFHALFQFQIMGVNGAFLTGDLFNLFVFFEVLLIASYGLMLHGAGVARFKAGIQYVTVNLAGSVLFLIAVGLIYGVTGTLNMADLAVKAPQVPAGDQALLKAGALLLLVVFAIKAALVPLHFWLPVAYAAACAPVVALFAIMTKVGAYSILRVYTLAFGEGAGELAWIAAPWLLPAALVTLALGTIGLLAARGLLLLACFAAVGSMGTLLVAIGSFTPEAVAAGLYYLVHSTLATAALFLVVGLIVERRGAAGDALIAAPRFSGDGALSALFMLAAVAMAGMPPLSGFIGKLLILDATREATATGANLLGWNVMGWSWAVILGTTLIALVGFARAGSVLFWKSAATAATAAPSDPHETTGDALPFLAIAGLFAAMAALTIFAGPAMDYFAATAGQLFAPSGYIDAVLGADRG